MIAVCGELIEVWTGGLISATAAEPRQVVLSVGGVKHGVCKGQGLLGLLPMKVLARNCILLCALLGSFCFCEPRPHFRRSLLKGGLNLWDSPVAVALMPRKQHTTTSRACREFYMGCMGCSLHVPACGKETFDSLTLQSVLWSRSLVWRGGCHDSHGTNHIL